MTFTTTAIMTLWLLGAGAGGDWSATFPPAATGSYLEADAAAVLVTPAGDPSPDLATAAQGVAAALRASGRAKLVMDGASIGSTAGLSDEQIVQKCQALPIQAVVVVRVFPGADAASPPSAVVTFYDKAGKALSALAAALGTPVAARESRATGGVSGGTLNAVGNVTHTNPADKTAQQKYDEQYIWFEELTGVNASGQVVGAWSLAYEGKYRKLLSAENLLQKVGRDDLSRQYSAQNARKLGFVWTGVIAASVGGALFFPALYSACSAKNAQTFECVRYDYSRAIGAGVAAAAGMGLWFYGLTIQMPVEPTEMRRLADEYNQKLKRDLGLAAAERGRAPEIRISLAPAGVSISGAF